MLRKSRVCCGWNVSDRSSDYGTWPALKHRDFAMTDETVRGPFALAVRLHVVEHPGFQGVMGNAVTLEMHLITPSKLSSQASWTEA